MLNNKELSKYTRQLILPEIGEEGQLKLKQAKVLVVGAGGLGCPVLQYLVASGIGKIGIVDGDVVGLSNLQRQVLFAEEDIGGSKALIAAEKLRKLNADIQLNAYPTYLTGENEGGIFGGYDIIVGATDNYESRYLIDGLCKKYAKPFVHGSVDGFDGQYSVFNCNNDIAYADVFPSAPRGADRVVGVMGALAGIIGSSMALEVIKICCGLKQVASDGLYVFKGLENKLIKLRY